MPTSSSVAVTPSPKCRAVRPFSPVASMTSLRTMSQSLSTDTLAPDSSPESSNGPAPMRWTDIVARSKVQPSPENSEMLTPFTARAEFHGRAQERSLPTEIW